MAVPRHKFSALGINAPGTGVRIYVTDDAKPIGTVNILSGAHQFDLIVDNAAINQPLLIMTIRILASGCGAAFLGLGNDMTYLPNVLMRSPNQRLLWGIGATAVQATIAIEGNGRKVIIGDDCMLSSEITIMNYDMHTIFDLESKEILNPPPRDIEVQQHVWIGQGAHLFNCQQIGFGSVLGAGTYVKSPIPPVSIYAGVPARKVREKNASWSRNVRAVSAETEERLKRLAKNLISGPSQAMPIEAEER
jgi:acetyltransferase-like isoleucine patch superfamily enzyme